MRLRKALRIAEEERDIQNSNGVLREAEPMRFAFIAAKKAEHRVTVLCRACASRGVASTRGAAAGPPRGRSVIAFCGRSSVRSMRRAVRSTVVAPVDGLA